MTQLSRYLPLFATEASDHLARMSAELVGLEAAARDGRPLTPALDELFRHAHSLKGMAASLELDGIATLAHRAEDLLAGARRGDPPLAPADVDLLLAAVDALVEMVERARAGAPGEAPAQLVAALEAAIRAGRAPPGAPPAPAAAPSPGPAQSPGPAEPAPSAAPGAPPGRLAVEVAVAEASSAPAVRAFLVVNRLGRLGAVVSCLPPPEALRAGHLPDRTLRVVLDARATAAEVEAALLRIPELARVQVRPGEPPRAEAPPADRARPRTVRVAVDLLDSFLDAVGELIQASAHLRELGRSVPEADRGPLDEGLDRLQATVRDLHDRAMAVRLTPLAGVTDRLPRAARDLARRTGKQVDVAVSGAEIQIDRAILDELSEPLLHVLRNAVDHGIEPPEERARAGKDPVGHVVITARRERDRVLVDVADDGRGMDPARLRRAAVDAGALTAEAAAALGDREALHLACLPGVSTARELTEVSGRGVGMDAVKRAVEALGGALDVASAPGAGTRWSLRLPLTMVVQPLLLVRVGGEVLGLPIAKVHGAAQVEAAELARGGGAPALSWAGRDVPVVDLRRVLGFDGPERRGPGSIVVAEGDGGQVGLAVDALLGQQEAVLRPLSRPLDQIVGLSAVTVLSGGRPVFVLDVPRLRVAS